MNMTDMLLQMTLQASWQLPQLSQSGQTAAAQDQQGTSFQDLLEQRREDLTQTGKTEVDNSQPEDKEVPVAGTEPDQEQQTPNLEAVAAAVAPMAMPNIVIPAEQEAAAPVVEAVVLDAPQTMSLPVGQQVQAEQAPVAETGVPQMSQPQQPLQTDGSVPQVQPTAHEVPAAEVPKVSDNTQNTAQENLTQDLTQPKASQNPNQELENVVVEHVQTPLFQGAEAVPVRVGDAQVDMTAPTQEVEKSLANVLKSALDQGDQRLEIKLSPANLGTVVAEFTRTPQGVLHVVLHAETEQTAKLLGDHASSLGLLLQDSNRGEVRVEVPQPQQGQQLWQQNEENSQRQQQQQQQQQQHTPRQESETFLHQLRLGLVGMDARAV